VSGTSRLEVGRIGRAHGLRGEVSVTLSSDRLERLAAGSVLDADGRTLVVESARPHAGRWLVCFEGVEDRTDAESLLGLVLTGDALPSEEDELWIHELIGAAVRDRTGRDLGSVLSVEANPASDLLVLDGDVLVPITFVVERGPGFVVVDPPEGLLDVNRRD
jgi:16S rRNA processing protein RimM